MGTNFYAKHPGMSADDEGLHIGKRSVGWRFLFRGYRDDNLTLTTAAEWREFLAHQWVRIVSEAGTEYAVDDFFRAIVGPPPMYTPSLKDPLELDEANPELSASLASKQWTDRHGYPFAGYEFC